MPYSLLIGDGGFVYGDTGDVPSKEVKTLLKIGNRNEMPKFARMHMLSQKPQSSSISCPQLRPSNCLVRASTFLSSGHALRRQRALPNWPLRSACAAARLQLRARTRHSGYSCAHWRGRSQRPRARWPRLRLRTLRLSLRAPCNAGVSACTVGAAALPRVPPRAPTLALIVVLAVFGRPEAPAQALCSQVHPLFEAEERPPPRQLAAMELKLPAARLLRGLWASLACEAHRPAAPLALHAAG